MPVVTSANSVDGPPATDNNGPKTDENANNVQTESSDFKTEATKEPQLSAEVSFEENHVRIVFQRYRWTRYYIYYISLKLVAGVGGNFKSLGAIAIRP